MSPRLVTVGELTLDDVVVEGGDVDWLQPGGGALYSAVGARLWSDDVAVSSVVGQDYPDDLLRRIADHGVDVTGVHRSELTAGIGLWLLYERDGTRRQVEKTRGGTFAEVDALRPALTDAQLPPGAAVHVAPQSSQGQVAALAALAGRDVLRTLDVLVEPGTVRGPYEDGSLLRDLDAFLPSAQEVRDLWGHADALLLAAHLLARGSRAAVALKRGPSGVDVVAGGRVLRVPSAVEDLVDPTGAGDAFCGGYLSGLADGCDHLEATVRGVVSSSFVCATRGALAALESLDRTTAEHRADRVRCAIREVP